VDSKKYIILIVILLLIVIGVYTLRAFDSKFRYSFDVSFNTEKEHKSFYIGTGNEVEVFTLPLPPSTTFAYKHSDSAVTYYSKLTYDEFLNYYVINGFEVQENVITYNGAKFKVSDVISEDDYKYFFIDIDLLKSE